LSVVSHNQNLVIIVFTMVVEVLISITMQILGFDNKQSQV
jgi:hypothetical protein